MLARAHHGSVSKEQRALIEDELKAGPAAGRGRDLAASSSASTWARSTWSSRSSRRRAWPAGCSASAAPGTRSARSRAGCSSRSSAATSCRPRSSSSGCATGASRRCACPPTRSTSWPSRSSRWCAMDDWHGRRAGARWSAGRRRSPRSAGGVLEAVLDMLSGRYPSDEFAELRPRLVWDRVTGTLTGRPGAQRLAVTSGGTIPDRGLFGVFLAGGDEAGGAGRGSASSTRRWCTSPGSATCSPSARPSWRIEEITHDRVLVTPAPGQPGPAAVLARRRPRPPGRAGPRRRRVRPRAGRGCRRRGAAPARRAAGLDDWAADNLLALPARAAGGHRHVPTTAPWSSSGSATSSATGGSCVHSPFGGAVHAPWALAVAARFRERFGVDVAGHARRRRHRAAAARRRDRRRRATGRRRAWSSSTRTTSRTWSPPSSAARRCSPPGSGSARRGPCCCRAAIPAGGSRCGSSASGRPSCWRWPAGTPAFPIVLETVRECLQDVFDVPGADRRSCASWPPATVRMVEVETPTPSPFARSLLFGYVAQFLYEGDSPLAERRAAALALDPAPAGRAARPRRGRGAARPARPGGAGPHRGASCSGSPRNGALRGAEGVADLLRLLGPLDDRRGRRPQRGIGARRRGPDAGRRGDRLARRRWRRRAG